MVPRQISLTLSPVRPICFVFMETPWSLVKWCYGNPAKTDSGMIALQQNRSRLRLVAVERTAGASWNFFIVDDLLPIQSDTHALPHDGRFELLPLTGRLRRVHARRNKTVDGAMAMRFRGLAVVVENLDFVMPAQVESAIAVLAHGVFRFHVKVLELLRGVNVVGFALIVHRAVFHDPTQRLVDVLRMPSIEILAVEQLHWSARLHLRCCVLWRLPIGPADRGPGARRCLADCLCPGESAAVLFGAENCLDARRAIVDGLKHQLAILDG